MLMYDPIPWLMEQEGTNAVRARRSLGLQRDGDDQRVGDTELGLSKEQLSDGSFGRSPLKTAGVLNLLDDMRATQSGALIERAVDYLTDVLQSQPGYGRAKRVKPGTLRTACDLCGFFGPYEDRNVPVVLANGAQEMNFYRDYEPLLGPKSPVRADRRSSLDRPGPSSCYSWGLIPLSYIVEALCRAGHGADDRLRPAVNALLGAQRASGGWCRNVGGHPNCTLPVLRTLSAHPQLRQSIYAERALEFMQTSPRPPNVFAALQCVARFDLPTARVLIQDKLSEAANRQRKNGTFGTPCPVERVAAVLAAWDSLT